MRSKVHSLGQHILVDSDVLSRIVRAAEITHDKTVCEVGTGSGALTAELCIRAGRVISFELDGRFYEQACAALLPKFPNLDLRKEDAFAVNRPACDIFISNLPYSRSRDAIEWLCSSSKNGMFERAVVMVQDEFAQKLVARPGEKEYRAVSALAQYCLRIERLFGVGRSAFRPPPKVESAVLKLVPVRSVTRDTIIALNLLFSSRNKKASSVAGKAGLELLSDARIRQLGPEALVELASKVHGNVRALRR